MLKPRQKKTFGQQRLIDCWPEVCYSLFPISYFLIPLYPPTTSP